MKPIELLVRSPRWDRVTQRAFRAHLAKTMRDAARLEYCRRKADFMMTSRAKRGALELITWALATFTKTDRRDRAFALSTRAQLLEELGDFAAAATAERAAGKADRSLAASSTHEARALLRASKLVATPEVLRLERRVARDPSARSLAAYAVWRHAILAFCAVARGQPSRARTHARKALALAANGATDFERAREEPAHPPPRRRSEAARARGARATRRRVGASGSVDIRQRDLAADVPACGATGHLSRRVRRAWPALRTRRLEPEPVAAPKQLACR